MNYPPTLLYVLPYWKLLLVAFLSCIAGTTAAGSKSTKCKATKFRALEDALLSDGDWMDWKSFTARYTGNEAYFGLPVIATEVSQVPCKAKGCCNLMVHLRPNTTDWAVFQEVFIQGGFAPVLELLEDPRTIVDAGAYAGFTSTLLALLYPEAQIIMVEPDPQNFMAAKLNTHRFRNVFAVNAGLWSKTACINLAHKQGEWGFVFQESAAVKGKCQGGLKAVSVAQVLKRFGMDNIDYFKVDIEGAESKVFSPESDLTWLQGTKLISIETHDRLAHLYGLNAVSNIVAAAMGKAGFEEFTHHELNFWHPIGSKTKPTNGRSLSKKQKQKEAQKKTEMQLEDETAEQEDRRRLW